MGRFAGKIASSSPAQAASLIQSLGSQLLSAKDSDAQQLYIGALGNAGLESCLPYLQKFVKSPRVKVRADAVAALRFIPSSKVDHILCDRLLHDDSDEVRAAAVFALGFRTYKDDNFGALILALRSDTSERVRRTALSTLWAQRDSQPAIISIVDDVAHKDASADIRKTATDLMNIDQGKG